MLIEDSDIAGEWRMWIVENCGLSYGSYVADSKNLTMRALEKNLKIIVKNLEKIKDKLSSSIGYQILTILILETGAYLPEKVRDRVLEYSSTDFDSQRGWRKEAFNLRKYYLEDLKEKVTNYSINKVSYLADLKIGDDLQLKRTCIGIKF